MLVLKNKHFVDFHSRNMAIFSKFLNFVIFGTGGLGQNGEKFKMFYHLHKPSLMLWLHDSYFSDRAHLHTFWDQQEDPYFINYRWQETKLGFPWVEPSLCYYKWQWCFLHPLLVFDTEFVVVLTIISFLSLKWLNLFEPIIKIISHIYYIPSSFPLKTK